MVRESEDMPGVIISLLLVAAAVAAGAGPACASSFATVDPGPPFSISIDPVPDLVRGDPVSVRGTTTLPPGETVRISIISAGGAQAVTGSAVVTRGQEGNNSWVFTTSSLLLEPGTHHVLTTSSVPYYNASVRMGTGSSTGIASSPAQQGTVAAALFFHVLPYPVQVTATSTGPPVPAESGPNPARSGAQASETPAAKFPPEAGILALAAAAPAMMVRKA